MLKWNMKKWDIHATNVHTVPLQQFFWKQTHIEYKHKGVRYNCDQFVYVATSAWDPNSDPFDPQDFGFLESDPQKYANPRIRIQGAKYQPKTERKKITLKTQIWNIKKREIIKISWFLNGSSSFSIKISETNKTKNLKILLC